jgi:hypothetical protein
MHKLSILDFWARINKTADCWFWTGAKTLEGYGMFSGRKATRVMMEIMEGPSDLHVLHSCRNRDCVNPKHLRYGTDQENMLDKVQDGTQPRGSKCYQAKLTDEQVAEIRKIGRTMRQKDLAARYGVGRAIIGAILLNQKWRSDGPRLVGDLRGSKNAQAKLTDQQVTEIRSLVGTIPQYKIAEQYGVSKALVSYIVNKKLWTHI